MVGQKVDFGAGQIDLLKQQIDALANEKTTGSVEWRKVDVLKKSDHYIEFLTRATHHRKQRIVDYLEETRVDSRFKTEFGSRLVELEQLNASLTGVDTGELRFHSLSLYVICRALKPQVVVETGVANGKSSAWILLALSRNQQGNLISVDLPRPEESRENNQLFIPPGKKVGWLVPDFLKDRWRLDLSDSIEFLRQLQRSGQVIDVFLHDSLHTYQHMMTEYELAFPMLRNGGVLLSDDILNNAAFQDFLKAVTREGIAFGTFGVIVKP